MKKYSTKVTLPSWASSLFIVISMILIPWTIYLSFALPAHHLSKNWDITWVGLDGIIILSLLSTGILARNRSIYVVISAIITGTLFITDAWFDILSYHWFSRGFNIALVMAIFGEIPMTIMNYSLAIHVLRKLHNQSK